MAKTEFVVIGQGLFINDLIHIDLYMSNILVYVIDEINKENGNIQPI